MTTTFVDVLLDLRHPTTDLPLSGGLIYTYEAGTTTPLVTYQDLDGEVENENPVELDSAGMAVIRQTDGVAYKWVVHDENDNLLFTRDDITVGFDLGLDSVYECLVNFCGSPDGGQWIGGDILTGDITLPADFTSASLQPKAECKINPTDDYIVSVKLNEEEIGTVTFDSDGLPTFATTSGDAVDGVIDDKLDYYAPITTDTIADIKIKLVGSFL